MHRRVVAVSLAALVSGLAFAPGAHASGPNLIQNAGFEQAYNPQPNVPTDGNQEGGFPVGWAFEGAGLPDHYSATVGGPGPYRGTFCAAISDPTSGGRHLHAQTPTQQGVPTATVDQDMTPTNLAKDTAAGAYSVVPGWRPIQALPVVAGSSYTVGGYYSWTDANESVDGVTIRLRWMDANGAPLGVSNFSVAAGHGQTSRGWTQTPLFIAVSPAGAAQVVPLFGAMDDNNPVLQVRWDDVYFFAT
jgi:hypothetical protein